MALLWIVLGEVYASLKVYCKRKIVCVIPIYFGVWLDAAPSCNVMIYLMYFRRCQSWAGVQLRLMSKEGARSAQQAFEFGGVLESEHRMRVAYCRFRRESEQIKK